ncbi:response regulator receiver protein [Crinalium epipsammum PCC 9333]|uniref:Response regulator receiver protein n=1 Tax=Crinalium epipsammum PCC 9333 TaxID=1173022 RepID=K9W6R4_9CYAN|nr:response regulator [Crinalium epipsammum]AFZ15457.1 response regulator receiver protein [Crinalium epipsammum PCC 9333]
MDNQFKVSRIQYLSWKQFNGTLNIQSSSGLEWSLLFTQGSLSWATGGVHLNRLWQRHLIQHCLEIIPELIDGKSQNQISSTSLNLNVPQPEVPQSCWQYEKLTALVMRDRITKEQFISVITGVIAEVLFDIIQQAAIQSLTYSESPQSLPDLQIATINTDQAFKDILQVWESWRKLGFAKISPNLAPIIKRPTELQQQTPSAVYQNFISRIDGQHTLRDLAAQMKQDLVLLTRSLIPYIRKGIIGLVEVADLPALTTTKVESTSSVSLTQKQPVKSNQTVTAASPLIACVDDSPQTCQIMEHILTQAGFRFVSIQDSVQALPILLQRKPDLIFLDLMMPVVNGYEICSQLRRVGVFVNTPMIILTGNDGLIDRVRAKVVGASDFVPKPVEAQKILAVVRKYFPVGAVDLSASKMQLS